MSMGARAVEGVAAEARAGGAIAFAMDASVAEAGLAEERGSPSYVLSAA